MHIYSIHLLNPCKTVVSHLKFKSELKHFPSQQTMAAGENPFVLELNEKELIELLEELSHILGAFLIKQLFHSRLLDMR